MTTRTFSGESLRAVAMPLGGIGTGTIAVAGDGSLRQWQIHHQINHLATVPHCFFAISLEGSQGRVAKVVQSDALYHHAGETPPPTSSDTVVPTPHRQLLDTLPGVSATEFSGPYPFANVTYLDSELPLDIRLTAWNPMIPFNADDSGIPALTFTFTIHNPTTATYRGTLAATMQNSVGWDGIMEIDGTNCPLYGGNRNEEVLGSGYTAVRMVNDLLPKNAAGNGALLLSTNAPGASACADWRDLDAFWQAFAGYGTLPPAPEIDRGDTTAKGETTNAALGVPFTIEPHGTRTISFQLAWYFPNRYINWHQWPTFGVPDEKSQFWVGTHYATVWNSVDEVSAYLWHEHDRLLAATSAFCETFTSSTLPDVLLDTVTAQMSILRSPTCFWAEDGNFYGFEGCNGYSTLHHAPGVTGSCPLNCTHVWNYEQSLAHLYPELDRTMRDTEWFLQQHASGYLPHRVPLPRYLPRIWERVIGGPDNPALDGLLGAILKTWREFRALGDLDWLKRCWPHVELALAFIREHHDPQQQGTIQGEQPNTYDISIYGLNSFIGTLYISALHAAANMAERLNLPDSAIQLRRMAVTGGEVLEERLWQGEWYIQEVDLEQYSEQNWATGLHSDHLLGQWWADVLQLPATLNPDHLRTAVQSIFHYNFRENLEGIPTPERWFAVPSDGGLINCTWPHEGRPEVPTRYSDEVWTGLEYEAAALLISTGQMQEAMTLLQAVRNRYDGIRMNPWNDIECGDHYVRAMSSWSLLLAATDFGWDAHRGELTVGNRTGQERLVAPFFASPAWGTYEIDDSGNVTIRVVGGEIEVKSIVVRGGNGGSGVVVEIDEQAIGAGFESDERGLRVMLADATSLGQGSCVRVAI